LTHAFDGFVLLLHAGIGTPLEVGQRRIDILDPAVWR
jgi:hypothetical protein